jgi:hypothetical protein
MIRVKARVRVWIRVTIRVRVRIIVNVRVRVRIIVNGRVRVSIATDVAAKCLDCKVFTNPNTITVTLTL